MITYGSALPIRDNWREYMYDVYFVDSTDLDIASQSTVAGNGKSFGFMTEQIK